MISLTPDEVKVVKEILAKYLPHVEVRVFGSRLRNDHKKYSDLDLLLIDKEKIPREVLFAMQDDFAESDLPFRVDLVDINRISAEFRKMIVKDAVPLFDDKN